MPEASRPDALQRPHGRRFASNQPGFDRVMQAHDAAMAGGDAGYLDPNSGLYVMTAAHLLARGYCCNNGCRHCPFVGANTVNPCSC